MLSCYSSCVHRREWGCGVLWGWVLRKTSHKPNITLDCYAAPRREATAQQQHRDGSGDHGSRPHNFQRKPVPRDQRAAVCEVPVDGGGSSAVLESLGLLLTPASQVRLFRSRSKAGSRQMLRPADAWHA